MTTVPAAVWSGTWLMRVKVDGLSRKPRWLAIAPTYPSMAQGMTFLRLHRGVHTSHPSTNKLRRLEELGVRVFMVNADMGNVQAVLHQPVIAWPLVNPPCGREQRKTVVSIDAHWDSVSFPFVGIKFWPSGAQQYMYGEHISDLEWETGSQSWTLGEPEIRGLRKKNVLWPSVEHIYGPTRTKSIKREEFTDYLIWVKAGCFTPFTQGRIQVIGRQLPNWSTMCCPTATNCYTWSECLILTVFYN